MAQALPSKFLRALISQTPLIIDQHRDGPKFQDALSGMSTPALQAFYGRLSMEERRRFHYAANICLGYESWSRLYRELVVQETQARLADRLDESYASKSEELRQREEMLATERQDLEEQVMQLEAENLALRRENRGLQDELARLRNTHFGLKDQQEQTLKLIERYKALITDLRRLLPEAAAQL
jgi:septal ring factor EnvC (AmiA/AmiB activator)